MSITTDALHTLTSLISVAGKKFFLSDKMWQIGGVTQLSQMLNFFSVCEKVINWIAHSTWCVWCFYKDNCFCWHHFHTISSFFPMHSLHHNWQFLLKKKLVSLSFFSPSNAEWPIGRRFKKLSIRKVNIMDKISKVSINDNLPYHPSNHFHTIRHW